MASGSESTLTSLAVLKATLDGGGDYYSYLRPFVLDVLQNEAIDPISDADVADAILARHGLVIPLRPVNVVLGRLAREGVLAKADGKYTRRYPLADVGLSERRAHSLRTVSFVVGQLRGYAKDTQAIDLTDEEASNAVVRFLSQLSIGSLRSLLAKSVLPLQSEDDPSATTLVGLFLASRAKPGTPLLDAVSELAFGAMLANALLAEDLAAAPKSYLGTRVFLDTPVVLRAMGLNGPERERVAREMISVLVKLGAEFAVFEHTLDETRIVLENAARWIDRPEGRGDVIDEARRARRSGSDLLLASAQLDATLGALGIPVLATPRADRRYQIEEFKLEDALRAEGLHHSNRQALLNDVKSVSAIYTLRAGRSSRSFEKSGSVMVSSNQAFARGAAKFAREEERGSGVQSVVLDFAISNMAWLKAPMDDPALPRHELLALAYAAFDPTEDFRLAVERELTALESNGHISTTDHQILRSTFQGREALIEATLGEEEALTKETVSRVVARVKKELAAEERERTELVESARRVVSGQLELSEIAREQLLQALAERNARDREKAENWARRRSRAATGLALALGIALVLFAVFGNAFEDQLRVGSGAVGGLMAVLTGLLEVLERIAGLKVPSLYNAVYSRALARALRLFTEGEQGR